MNSVSHERPEPFSYAELEQMASERRRLRRRGLAGLWIVVAAGSAYMYFSTGDAPFAIAVFAIGLLGATAYARRLIPVPAPTTPARLESQLEALDVDRDGPALEAVLERAAERERLALRVGLVGGWICCLWMMALSIAVDEVGFVVVFGICLAGITRYAGRGLRTLDERFETRRRELRTFLAKQRGPDARPSGA